MKPSELMEHAVEMFPSPEDSFDRLIGLRDRRRRNQRIGSAVLALVLTVGAIGTLFYVFGATTKPQPAGPTITPSNVKNMSLSWIGQVDGWAGTPVVSDSTVYVSGYSEEKHRATLYAFPTSCSRAQCDPTWTVSLGSRAGDTPAVADGVVYVAGGIRSSGMLFAFPASCGDGGAVCEPIWTGRIGGEVPSNDLGPVVADGVVYIGSGGDSSGRHLFSAFPATCEKKICDPLWQVKLPLSPTSWAVVGDRVFVGTASGDLSTENFSGPRHGILFAFPRHCSDGCDPTWTWDSLGRIWDLAAGGNDLYVGTDAGYLGDGPGLYRIHAYCATNWTCSPVWQANTKCCTRVTVSGDLVVAHDEKWAVYAFPKECGLNPVPVRCEPTWTSIVTNPLYFGTPVIEDGLVWVGSGKDGSVSALPVSCSGYCLPLWKGSAGDDVVGVAVADGKVFASSDGLFVFAPRQGATTTHAKGGSSVWLSLALVTIGAALLGAVYRRRSRRRYEST